MHLFQSFRAARWLRSTNLLLQAILFVTLFIGLNQLARYNSWRFDLTQLRRHSLSVETLAYLEKLGRDQPVKIRLINTFPRDATTAGPDAPADLAQINADIAALIREYTYALEPNTRVTLQVEAIDVYQRPRDAEQYKLEPYRIVFLSGENRRELKYDDLYQTKNNQRVAFIGEQAFTAAILGVTNPEKTKIYFLTGHGEMDINNITYDRGLSEIRDALRDRNYAIETLDLSRTRAIPGDADKGLILSIGAQTRYEPYEQELLRDYMTARAGRIILCASPGNPSPDGLTGLENLLGEWGILVDNTWIYDRAATIGQPGYSDLIISNFPNPHPVVKPLIDKQLVLRFGATRSVRPDPIRATDPGLSVTPLAVTGTTAWGARNYQLRPNPRFDPAVDLPGPLPVVTVTEKVTAKNDLRFSVRVGSIIVFGGSDFVANGRLRAGANNTLFFSAIDWLVERDPNLNIPARPIEKFQLALTHDQLARLRAMLMFGVPGIFALVGLIVYWTRRR